MAIDAGKYSRFLENVADAIDIAPSKYQDAVDRYKSVGHWLEGGEYPGSLDDPSIYTQGSFRLGTVVRPIRGGVEAEYDIDLVCELPIPKHATNAHPVKMMIGRRLYEHERYRKLLDEEGKRCWTLQYAEQDGIGFHLDVLPSVPDGHGMLDTSIAITNKSGTAYQWSASNPKGYGEWFDKKNQAALELVLAEQKRSIQSRASTIYLSVDDVPDRLVRTPLQRSIQIMKRHRDSTFNSGTKNENAPISIILTTLAAHLYDGERDVFSALTGIVSKLSAYAGLVDNDATDWILVSRDLIVRTPDGKWFIENPVNSAENFADRWHEENHARARAFFSWVKALKADLVDILTSGRREAVRQRLTAVLGASVVSSHIGLIASTPAAAFTPPRIAISEPAKPWGPNGGCK